MSLSCATCKSKNVQKLSLAYENGLSDLNGTQTTSGVGISRGGLGFGSSRSKFKGTNQSALSQKASPPLKKRVIKNAFIHLAMAFIAIPLVVGLVSDNTTVSGVAVFLYLAFAIYDTIISIRFNIAKYPNLYDNWTKQFICLTCGDFFAPESN